MINNITAKTITVVEEISFFHQTCYTCFLFLVLFLVSSDYSRGPIYIKYERSSMGYMVLFIPSIQL